MSEIKNARIVSTMLGYEDHGILTCMVHLDYGGSGQGFGGYAFDEWNEAIKKRVPCEYGMQFVSALLRVVGVECWEDLPGKYIRVDADHNKVYRIGNVLREQWFDPNDLNPKSP